MGSKVYIAEIGGVDFLSEAEEAAVFANYKTGCNNSYDVLLTAHIPVIVKTAKQLKKSNDTQLSFLDLIEFGREGAEKAINEYSQTLDERLPMYVHRRVRDFIESNIAMHRDAPSINSPIKVRINSVKRGTN